MKTIKLIVLCFGIFVLSLGEAYSQKRIDEVTLQYNISVESTNEKLTSPVIYEVSPELMFEELYGNIDKRKIGFSELISTYLFHNYTDEWIYDKNVVDSNGIITLTQWS